MYVFYIKIAFEWLIKIKILSSSLGLSTEDVKALCMDHTSWQE